MEDGWLVSFQKMWKENMFLCITILGSAEIIYTVILPQPAHFGKMPYSRTPFDK